MVSARLDLRALLMVLVFLHGAFAAGMVPVLNKHLGETAPWAFAGYFGAMLAAQGAIYAFPRLTRHPKALGFYELLFAGALIYMALTMTHWGFLSGRLWEGIGSGLTLPLIFAGVLRLEAWGGPEKRIAFMNSSFALGFVAGPFLVQGGGRFVATPAILLGFAALFGVSALGVLARPVAPALEKAALSHTPPGLARFWPLFVAKLAYGFMFSFLSGHAQAVFPDLALAWVMLGLAGVFVVVQVATTLSLKVVGVRTLLRAAPLVLAAAAAVLALTGLGAAVFLMSVGHSVLVLLGYRMLAGDKADDARTFALYNLSTDPALVLGALLALAGPLGGWGLVVVGLVATALPLPPPEVSSPEVAP
jgi:MFS family permease